MTQASNLLETAERRAFVLKQRKGGATYRMIADAAIAKFGVERLPKGWDELYAYKDGLMFTHGCANSRCSIHGSLS